MRRCLLATSVLALLVLGGVAPAQAAFPGENGLIAFARGAGIFSIKPNGSGLMQLTPRGELPSYSPNGLRLLFYRGETIWEMRAHGANKRLLLRNAGFASYSPNGRRILFRRNRNLWVLNRRTLEKTRLTRSGRFTSYSDAVFSPSGDKIAVAKTTYPGMFATTHIYVMKADGTNERLVAGSGYAEAPDFSPDGRQIVFGDASGCFVVNLDGSNLHRLSRGSTPAFSPDGKRIAFSQRQDPWVMSADGSNKRRLLDDGLLDSWPTWGAAFQGQPVFPTLLLADNWSLYERARVRWVGRFALEVPGFPQRAHTWPQLRCHPLGRGRTAGAHALSELFDELGRTDLTDAVEGWLERR